MKSKGSAELPPLLTMCMLGASIVAAAQLDSIVPIVCVVVAIVLAANFLSKIK